jgi:histidine triad (HIT) family protein
MQISHAPEGYVCPICIALKGVEDGRTLVHQTDIFYRDDLVTGFINSFSLGGVTGNALIVPNEHFEHIYEIPVHYGHRVFEVLQKTATAMRHAYGCEGITTLQCNEPAGWQHAFHYHHHVMQRTADDGFLHSTNKTIAPKKEKASYALKLKTAMSVI